MAIILLPIFYFKLRGLQIKVPAQKSLSSEKIVNTPANKEIVITESELNNLISDKGTEYLEGSKTTILEDRIIFEGKAKKLFGQNINIQIFPEVVEGKIVLTVLSAKVGPINAPKAAVEKILAIAESEINKKFSINNILSIKLETGKLILKTKGE